MDKNGTKECVTTRTVLWYLVFTGFGINYMLRINLNIAIVSMIKLKPVSNTSLTSECIASTEPKSFLINKTKLENNTTTPKNIQEVETREKFEGFEWNEYEQGLILGAFYWLHWATQIPGGLLANKYGTKLVFGVSNFIGVLCCFFIPIASLIGYEWLIVIRVVQGTIAGFAWPAMHTLTARWIPPNERSKFVTAYLGSSVGAALTFGMCGIIIDVWGWEYVFYVSGILGTLWYAAWCFLLFDSPSEHPRISDAEKEYILNSLGQSVSKERAPVPWKAILTSIPVWMNVLAQVGGLWGLFTIMTQAPTYFKRIHGWNITATGFLSGLPHLARMLFAYVFSLFADYLLTHNKASRTNVRKFATAFCNIGQGLCMIMMAYSGCNHILAIVLLTTGTAIHGAVSTGALANLVDISPNYASILLGMANGSGAICGMLSPLVVGLLTHNNQTAAQWQKVFWITACILIVSGILYVLFAQSELQWWNSPSNKYGEAIRGSELITLNQEKICQNLNNNEIKDSDIVKMPISKYDEKV